MQDKPQRCKHFMSVALPISSLCFPNQSMSPVTWLSLRQSFLLLTFALESRFFVHKKKKKKKEEKEIIFESGH